MIYGTEPPKIEKIYNEFNKGVLKFTLPNIPHTVVTEYNIPDILLQKAVNGRIIKILKGYYHRFTIDIYNITSNVLAFCEMISNEPENCLFYPHFDNLDFYFNINSVSSPFYVNDTNGNQAVRIIVTTVGYENLVESNIDTVGGTGGGITEEEERI